MSIEEMDQAIGRMTRERKDARTAIAVLEREIKDRGAMLSAIGGHLSSLDVDPARRVLSEVQHRGGIEKILVVIDEYSTLRNREAELTRSIAEAGAE